VSVLTLAEARAYLEVGTSLTVSDTLLQIFIDAAEDTIADLIGPLVPTSVTALIVPTNGTLVLPHIHCPFISLTSATNLTYGGTLPPASFVLTPGNVLTLPFAYIAPGTWSVVFQSGYNPLPARAKTSCLELVRQMWKTQRSGTGVDAPGTAHALTWRVMEPIQTLLGIGMA
jgi:hypothetical protein